ncbi:MAG: glycoside hydrolase family 5 protein [Sphingobacteriales bacterium]|nr:glycoside hydrolase family 5 protein [Sphingobacteriales bacterium]
MKKAKIIFSLFLCVFYFSLTVKATPPSIIGKWYGLKDGSPVTVMFRNNQTMSIQADAFSGLTFTSHYKIDSSVSPIAVDLIMPGSMICTAILNFSDHGEMEFFGFLGTPGQAQRPAKIDSNPKRPDALYLKLSRDIKVIHHKPLTVSPPKEATLAFERNKRLGRGLNLNGLLDNNSGDLHLYPIPDQPIKLEYIKMIADAGFNSVRLPVTWVAHSSKTPPYTIDPAFFRRVDSIVKQCLQNGLAVSIDMHYYPYINMGADSSISFDDNIKRFYSLWEQIAKHYKDYPPEVYFDILNEPNMDMGVPFYNELIAKSVKLIRKTNPYRTILIGTPNLGQSWTIGLLDLPKEDWNLIVQIHYYLPHLFTHQGLAYAHAAASKGMQWMGTKEERKPIESDLTFCAKWSKAHSRPINLGEFGVNEYAAMSSRARYFRFIRELADKNGFSFHVWGFREIFRVFDEESGRWHQPVLDALIPGKHYLVAP